MSGETKSPRKSSARLLRGRRGVQRFIVLPTSLLVLNIVEEISCYKAQVLVPNPYWRTAALMLMFICGFGLVGLVLVPMISVSLEKMYLRQRERRGPFGELLVLALIYGALFVVYYLLYGGGSGAVSLLPHAWRN